MTSYVFDTGALSLFFSADERLRPLVERVQRGSADGFLSSVTLAEFFYKTCQTLGRDTATLWSRQLGEKVQVLEADLELSLSAGLEKCKNNNLSLADSYALAVTRRVHGTLLTTDSELAKAKDSTVRFFEV